MDSHLSLVLVALLSSIALVQLQPDCDDKEGKICHSRKYSCEPSSDFPLKNNCPTDEIQTSDESNDCDENDDGLKRCDDHKRPLNYIQYGGQCCEVLTCPRPRIAHCSYEQEKCPKHYICVPQQFRLFKLDIRCPLKDLFVTIEVKLPVCCGCECCKRGDEEGDDRR